MWHTDTGSAQTAGPGCFRSSHSGPAPPRVFEMRTDFALIWVTKVSIRVHGTLWPDEPRQPVCSRAYRMHGVDWRWRVYIVVVDAISRPLERNHCRESFFRYH